MKTLKFMLAAATAIGLASATQADEFNTTGFEKLTVGTNVTTGVQDNRDGYSYFYYAGSVAEDNESVIAAAGDMTGIARPRGAASVDAGRDKILQVSTGTDPLLRTFAPRSGGAPQAPTPLEGTDVYVDTLVQFTVTPYTDTVTPGSADKLMIYLKESVTTNEMGEITSADTNLVVVGGFYSANATTAKEYVLDVGPTHKKVNPNTWYRLTVKAITDVSGTSALGMPGFAIWVDGEECVLDTYTMDENDQVAIVVMASNTELLAKKQVLSLLTGSGGQAASLQGVGFAGEGKVDDVVFSELDPFATVYDFTFAFDATKVTAIEYTVAGTSYSYANVFPEVTAGTEVQITSITYADEWLAGTIDAVNMSDPVAGVYTVTNAGASLTINPEVFFPRTNTADQDGSAAHPYEVADAAAIVALQKGLAGGKDLTGKNFQLTADIDMTGVTGFYGIGWFTSIDSKDASLNGLSGDIPFAGTFDGNGRTISNLTLVKHNYAGLFNLVTGTVKDLTVSNFVGFTGTADEGGFAIVGATKGTSVLQNLTMAGTFGTAADLNHNSAGIVIRAGATTTVTGCVNNADIAVTAKRVGGIVAFTGDSGDILITCCTNNGDLSATGANGGKYGSGGISGTSEASQNLKIENCANFGTVTVGGGSTYAGNAGLLVGNFQSRGVDELGGNTYLASGTPFGNINGKTLNKCSYALPSTIDNADYLTTVKDSDLAAGNQYTLLADVAASETPVFTLAADGDFIAFLLGSYTFAGTVNGAEGLDVTSATESGVLTFTAATSAPTGEELEPGEQSSTTYDSQAAAEAAAANVTIAASDAVTNALDAAAQATYLEKFEAKVSTRLRLLSRRLLRRLSRRRSMLMRLR